MSSLEVIKAAIEALPPEKFVELRQWFSERDWDQWDEQIAADFDAGKLDFLIEEARQAHARGELKDL